MKFICDKNPELKSDKYPKSLRTYYKSLIYNYPCLHSPLINFFTPHFRLSLHPINKRYLKTFSELGISPAFIKALEEINIINPTEIQEKAIPFLIEKGTDFIGQAQTGTGKTAAYGLPVLQSLNPDKPNIQALILSPTRELGQQIAKQLFKFTKHIPKKIFIESVCGGAHIDEQVRSLRRPTHIVVATPGRLVDLLERKAIDLTFIRTLILDEADEMLSMGFRKDLDIILKFTAGKRHTWLFSATMPQEIKSIISVYMSPQAMRLEINRNDIVNRDIEHKFLISDRVNKPEALFQFLRSQGTNRGLVFCRTKIEAQTVAKRLQAKNVNADALHGDMFQKERDKVMRAFKNSKLQILVATDLAARGIDVKELAFVVHYQLPEKAEYYTHRSGRTGRAGNKGFSLSIITPREYEGLKGIEKELGIKVKEILR
jgi:ATP-dependent RNA helicase DeaD